MTSWNKFVKCFQQEYNLTYAQALATAGGPYRLWKDEEVKRANAKEMTNKKMEMEHKKKERVMKKTTKYIEESDEEPPKKKY